MDLTPYAKKLAAAVSAKDKAALEELCFDLEGEQLGVEYWSPAVFNFFIDALQDQAVCQLPGSSSLVMSLYNDFEKLTSKQVAVLLKAFDENADEFGDEMVRHSASDLIARKYEPEVALKQFTEWMKRATPNRLHMAQVGFEVLIMARRLEPAAEPKVRGYLEKLWQRQD